MSVPVPASFRDIYSVSRLTSEVRVSLEGRFPGLWIEGEISNLARPGSGHLYFSLKDAGAQVRCAMFKPRSQQLGFKVENGQAVLARARVSLYEPRGDFQLIVEHLEPAGDGALRAAFEALKQRLSAEGLFASERKRPLPRLPRAIGVVTSPTGAAIRDVLSVLARRWPRLPVVIYPCLVQGNLAAPSIVNALQAAGRRAEVDVVLLVRGGGSLEDLWPFNEEGVARAIHASPIPVVSGVGHETDVSISDWVADLRAPTPSVAAELVCPDRQDLLIHVGRSWQRLHRECLRLLDNRRHRLQLLKGRLVHPARRLEQMAQRLDELSLRSRHSLALTLQGRSMRLQGLDGRLRQQHPRHTLARLRGELQRLAGRPQRAIAWLIQTREQRLRGLTQLLRQVSPEATLARGYAIVQRVEDAAVVRSVHDTAPNARLTVRLSEGRLKVQILEASDAPQGS